MAQCPPSPTHPFSVQSLQSELRSLCVSSPPSIQTSPIKGKSCSPQSPPAQGNYLQMISEENLSSQPHNSTHNCTGPVDKLPISLPNSPLPFFGRTFTPPHSFRTSPSASPTATPVISVTDESGGNQCIRMLDSNPLEFPIIPPPHAFAPLSQSILQHQQQQKVMSPLASNEEKMSDDKSELEEPPSSSSPSCSLHRWKDGKVSHGLAA